MLILRFSF